MDSLFDLQEQNHSRDDDSHRPKTLILARRSCYEAQRAETQPHGKGGCVVTKKPITGMSSSLFLSLPHGQKTVREYNFVV